MTGHQTMNTIIHAGFRRDLARFDRALADFPIGSRARADQLATAWTNLAEQLHHHHRDEETIFFPAFRDLGVDHARHAAAPRLKNAQATVRKANKGGAGTFFAWLTAGADPATKTALRREVPPPVLFVLGRVGGRRYRRDIATVWT